MFVFFYNSGARKPEPASEHLISALNESDEIISLTLCPALWKSFDGAQSLKPVHPFMKKSASKGLSLLFLGSLRECVFLQIIKNRPQSKG